MKTYSPTFPSHGHQQLLQSKAAITQTTKKGGSRVIGYDAGKLNEDERKQYYAYDHAMHRIASGDLVGGAPADPLREHFVKRLVDLAETQFRRELDKPRAGPVPHEEPWRYRVAAAYRWAHSQGNTMPSGLPENSPAVLDLVRRYEAISSDGDKIRTELKALADANPKNQDGSPSPEALAYVAECVKQSKQHLTSFLSKNRAATKPKLVYDQLLDDLGVHAIPKKE